MCLSEGNLVVLRVKSHQDVAGIDILLILRAYFNHVTGKPSAHRVDVTVDLGVVCTFVSVQVSPEVVTTGGQNNDNCRQYQETPNSAPSAWDDFAFFRFGHCYFTSTSL